MLDLIFPLIEMLQRLHLIIMGINHHLYEFSPTSKTFGTSYSWDEAIRFKICQHSFLFSTFKFSINKNLMMSLNLLTWFHRTGWMVDWLIHSFIPCMFVWASLSCRCLGYIRTKQTSLSTGAQGKNGIKNNHNKYMHYIAC